MEKIKEAYKDKSCNNMIKEYDQIKLKNLIMNKTMKIIIVQCV